ncbi:MAG: ABC transporter permease [Fimbriimonadaceae bacterium]
MNDLITLFAGTIGLSAPLILAAMGGLVSERSGIINIALEGKMLIAAVAVWLIGVNTGNPFLGLAAGIGAASLLSVFHWILTQRFAVDHVVSGMAINALAFGGSNFLDKKYTNPSQVNFAKFDSWLYWIVAIGLPVVIWIYLARTRGGLRLMAVGNDPDKSRQMGLFPQRIRLFSLVGTGVFCGIAGSLIVSYAGSFNDGMTSGKGFIALAALIVGGWRPMPALIACLVFGMLNQLQIQFQGVPVAGVMVPNWVWLSLPYLATVVALAGFMGKDRTPKGLGKP